MSKLDQVPFPYCPLPSSIWKLWEGTQTSLSYGVQREESKKIRDSMVSEGKSEVVQVVWSLAVEPVSKVIVQSPGLAEAKKTMFSSPALCHVKL